MMAQADHSLKLVEYRVMEPGRSLKTELGGMRIWAVGLSKKEVEEKAMPQSYLLSFENLTTRKRVRCCIIECKDTARQKIGSRTMSSWESSVSPPSM
jgi:hypothetical protein